MIRIQKEFAFSASHQLFGLEEDHPCGRLHGHNYRVQLILEGTPKPPSGFVVDFRDLDPFKQFLDAEFDHRHLNDVPCLDGLTTSENLATVLLAWCHERWPETVCVRVSETEKTWAEAWRSGQWVGWTK